VSHSDYHRELVTQLESKAQLFEFEVVNLQYDKWSKIRTPFLLQKKMGVVKPKWQKGYKKVVSEIGERRVFCLIMY
jgi:hypothetical protein